MPRDNNYDFVGGRMSGRAIEQIKLKTFYTKIRLKNNGKKNLYYLSDSTSPSYWFINPKEFSPAVHPKGGLLSKSITNKTFYRSPDSFKVNPGFGLTWIVLPRGSQIEFEVAAEGYPRIEHSYLMYLNDEPVFWDEIEIMTVNFPSMFREFKSESSK